MRWDEIYENTLRRNSINRRICGNVRRVIEQNVSVLQRFLSAPLSLLWLRKLCAKPFVLCVCVCEIFMQRSGDVLWGCSSGERQAASFSLPLSLSSFSFALSLLCMLHSVARHCSATSPSSFPLVHSLSPFLHLSLLHRGEATPLCASSPVLKAIHFLGLFENRLRPNTHRLPPVSSLKIPSALVWRQK